ncbi:nitroreductase family protein [Pelobacter seleniigenes]|uniref:nitroreductase family protein n=1 Tax=Pelobacter seleniigenes TaxID=407188 RepID=UPI0004A6DF12|nr:nitroreductase family protein [Pelobacter seleniigenes]
MLQLTIDNNLCTRCGSCAQDCPAKIISLTSGLPAIAPADEGKCIRCQHCLAVCPTAALSIFGHQPVTGRPLAETWPAPQQLEALIKGRRSVRQYRDENLEPALLEQLLEVAWHAPTGVNRQSLQFHVIDDKDALAVFRNEVYAELGKVLAAGQLPERLAHFGTIARRWQEDGSDILFRGAPHLLAVSSGPDSICPEADGFIALSYFELYAQSQGVGAVWDGMMKWLLEAIAPGLQQRLGIPADHKLGYVMVFGKPAVQYQRPIQRGPARVSRFQP